jgi:hypothetical protein
MPPSLISAPFPILPPGSRASKPWYSRAIPSDKGRFPSVQLNGALDHFSLIVIGNSRLPNANATGTPAIQVPRRVTSCMRQKYVQEPAHESEALHAMPLHAARSGRPL